MDVSVTRRQILQTAALSTLSMMIPRGLSGFDPARGAVRADRILILLEFVGGNDGLNMLVPYADPVYQAARSTPDSTTTLKLEPVTALDPVTKIVPDEVPYLKDTQCIPFSVWSNVAPAALPANQVGSGVHARFDLLTDAWRAGDLAFVHGVGYPNPNQSHFRSIDIWLDGTDDTQRRTTTGWLGRMLAAETVPAASANTAGVIFSGAGHDPFRSPVVAALAMDEPQIFIDRSSPTNIPIPTPAQLAAASGNPALSHVLHVQSLAAMAHDTFDTAVSTPPVFTPDPRFPRGDLADQVKYVAQCIAGGLPCICYKIAIGGFDNHVNQKLGHGDNLAQIADAMRVLRNMLTEKGMWDKVLVMSFSEFGRRMRINGSNGTDHGTAAPHFFLGGKVKGGVYGTQPSLSDLDAQGNLKANTDFRQMYATCGKWLGISDANIKAALDPITGTNVYTPIDCVDWA